ncbi:MAG: glycosyltransferase family 9 protein [Halothiobacillaceae bacterium]
MKVAVIAGDAPADLIRMMPALTDAGRSVPGLELTLLGSTVVTTLARRHDTVRRALDIPIDALSGKWWDLRLHRRRGRVRKMFDELDAPFDRVVDGLGRDATAALARLVQGERRCGPGRDQLASAALAKCYDDYFPIPDHLHPVQRHRVMLAAVLDYGIHDLKPDYGLLPATPEQTALGEGVVLSVAAGEVGWTDAQVAQVVDRIEEAGIAVTQIPPAGPEPGSEDSWWSVVESAGYVIASDNATAHLAAALGRPGLTLCPEGQAATCSAVSNRHARRAMVGIDQSRLVRPEVVAEATLRTLERIQSQDGAETG